MPSASPLAWIRTARRIVPAQAMPSSGVTLDEVGLSQLLSPTATGPGTARMLFVLHITQRPSMRARKASGGTSAIRLPLA
jgi:hypothetical protein